MKAVFTLTLCLWASGVWGAAGHPEPLVHAHAHNDYEHERPLLDALDHGFCSVEADIHLVDGRLLVAHDRDQVEPGRTLEALYLKPLRDQVQQHDGRVYPGGPVFTLLVDIKSEAESTYEALREVLKRYADMLTTFGFDETRQGAVTVILSGNRPQTVMRREPLRYAALDGRLEDLSGENSVHFMPWISDRWSDHFNWNGAGEMPDAERRKLREIVRTAHWQGRRIRFWAIPDRPEAWEELLDAGVDLINTDRLSALQQFLSDGNETAPNP